MLSIDELIKKVKGYNPDSDISLIKKAYLYAEKAHTEDKRASGEPFIIHPLNVAFIVADFRMDDSSICAALLHDTVEDTGTTLEDIKKEFSEEVALLVDGVTKITALKSKSREEYQAESLRKMLLATTKDIRILIIKLCDKLHNMRTLSALSIEKQIRIAKETRNIYAPLAYRLGIERVKWELEDLAFKALEPAAYKEIDDKINKNRKEREEEVERLQELVTKVLKDYNIESVIKGRAKHHFSIYKKMLKKQRSFEEIFDVLALRIVAKSVRECYEVLGIIHNLWKPIPRHFKDYIAMPKTNFYQSLHTIVITPEGTIIEIQIRTEDMDKIAEEGIAAHWKYKGVALSDKQFDKKTTWLKQILEWQQETGSKEFVEGLELDFFKDEIYVFTPKGEVRELPANSTILDFAYDIHTNLGDKCIGAKVNGTFCSLRHELKTGDVVEILTAKTQKPHRSWLKIVHTTKAKQKIKKHILDVEKIPAKVFHKVNEETISAEKNIISVAGVAKPKIHFSQCCTPLPGEKIVGFASKTGIVNIHNFECDSTKKVKETAKKKVKVVWEDQYNDIVELTTESADRVGLFVDVLNTIAATGTNIDRANGKITGIDAAECHFHIRVDDLEHLKDIISRVQKIQGIKKVIIGKTCE